MKNETDNITKVLTMAECFEAHHEAERQILKILKGLENTTGLVVLDVEVTSLSALGQKDKVSTITIEATL